MFGFNAVKRRRTGVRAAIVAVVLLATAACGSQGDAGNAGQSGPSQAAASAVQTVAPQRPAADPVDVCSLLNKSEVTAIGVPYTPDESVASTYLGKGCVWGETNMTTLFVELHATCDPVPADMMRHMDSQSGEINGGPPGTRLWYVIRSVPTLYAHKDSCTLSVSSANVPVSDLMSVFNAAYERL